MLLNILNHCLSPAYFNRVSCPCTTLHFVVAVAEVHIIYLKRKLFAQSNEMHKRDA